MAIELSDFDIHVSANDGHAVVTVKGDVDLYTAPVLEQQLTELVDDGAREIVVDVADMTFMDTTGLSVLVTTFRRLQPHEGRMSLRSPRPSVRKTLEITGLDAVFLPV